jgi:hypothetical protein
MVSETEVFEPENTKALWKVTKKGKLVTVNYILVFISRLNDKQNEIYNSCARIACCSSELIFTFFYAGSSIQNAKEQFVSCIHLSFVNFALHPNPQTKIQRIKTPHSNSPISVTIQN